MAAICERWRPGPAAIRPRSSTSAPASIRWARRRASATRSIGAIERLTHYPDPENAELVAALAAHYRLPAAQIVAGNGSSEILFALARACDYDRAVIAVPSYIDYAAAVQRAGRPLVPLPLDEHQGFVLDLAALEDQLHGGELVAAGTAQQSYRTGLRQRPVPGRGGTPAGDVVCRR